MSFARQRGEPGTPQPPREGLEFPARSQLGSLCRKEFSRAPDGGQDSPSRLEWAASEAAEGLRRGDGRTGEFEDGKIGEARVGEKVVFVVAFLLVGFLFFVFLSVGCKFAFWFYLLRWGSNSRLLYFSLLPLPKVELALHL